MWNHNLNMDRRIITAGNKGDYGKQAKTKATRQIQTLLSVFMW